MIEQYLNPEIISSIVTLIIAVGFGGLVNRGKSRMMMPVIKMIQTKRK